MNLFRLALMSTFFAHPMLIAITESSNPSPWDPLDRFESVVERLYSLTAFEDQISSIEERRKVENSEHYIIVQKKIVPNNAHIYVKGDIHGDEKTIPALIRDLQQKQLIDETYKLDDTIYLVFLGDYIDRGPNSIEVIRQITQLKKRNPNNVILLRGNHETKPMLLNKAAEKYDPNKISKQLSRIPSKYRTKRKLHQEKMAKILAKLNAAFAHMPQVVFIGYQDETTQDHHYIACLHGGIPNQPQKTYYPKSKQGQKEYKDDERLFNAHLTALREFLNETRSSNSTIRLPLTLKIIKSGASYYTSPYLWNDFFPTDKSAAIDQTTPSIRGRHIWSLGSAESINWLTNISTSENIVHAILRGHQQSPRFLFEVPGHEGLAIRNKSDVLTLDYSPRVKGFKAKRDIYLILTPDTTQKTYFKKQIKSFMPKNGVAS